MRLNIVLRYIGLILLLNAAFLLLSACVSLLNGMDTAFYPLLQSFLLTAILGAFPLIFVQGGEQISSSEGYGVVVGAWLMSCLMCMLPYMLWGGEFTLADAWFESVSGFTTTGSTSLSNVEALPKGLLFWRASTHWLGGVGVVMFVLVVLPSMGSTKMRLSSVELSSMAKDNFRYRTQKTLQILIVVYVGLTLIQTVLLKIVGVNPVIVHGGGKEISRWVEKAGMEPEFVNGLRKTDEATMEIAEMVLNKVNKSLVKLVQELGVNAVGISGKDGGLLNVEKKLSKGEDIGFVGNIKNVNPKVLYDLLENDFLPVVCPVGMDDDFNTYNINADDAACAIAEALNAEKLAFLTDIEGVYKDPKDPESLISELHVQEARDLITNGNVGGGMIPKLQGCIDAIENGVSRVHIMDGRIPHCLLLEIFTNKGIGTAILGENKEKFNHEDE